MPSSRGVTFPAPFPIAPGATPGAASPYAEKRAELARVVETLLLLPPRLAHAPPFAERYDELAAKRRALEKELAALEAEWA